MNEIKTVESITTDNLRLLENILLDIQDVENTPCGHPQCASDEDPANSDAADDARWKPESMTQRLEWAMALLQERETDLRRMNDHFEKALKNVSSRYLFTHQGRSSAIIDLPTLLKLLDICIIEQNDRSVVADTMNKAILLFTGITVVFLPLSFITSYLGMNLSDIRETGIDQVWFWKYLGSTGLVISVASILYTSRIHFRSFPLTMRGKMKAV